MAYSYVINPKVYNEIDTFYANVANKYSETYSLDLMIQNITKAYDAINYIENGFPRRRPTLTRWRDYHMASYMVKGKVRWNYAYRIEGQVIYVEDACHAQNMHESRKLIRLTETQFKRILTECITKIINEIA